MQELKNLTKAIVNQAENGEKPREKNHKRKQFTFYRNYYDVISSLPKTKQLKMFHAICGYALDGKENELEGTNAAMFELVKPVLERGRKLSEAAVKSGRSEVYTAINEKKISAKDQALAKLSEL